jgi:23S rRNA (cytidine2498-2'-O)-methyltransferase
LQNKDKFDFVAFLCQAGAERALKAEVSLRLPAARLAYSRPGFVTFKTPADQLSIAQEWVFAQCIGKNPSRRLDAAPSPGECVRAAEVAAFPDIGPELQALHLQWQTHVRPASENYAIVVLISPKEAWQFTQCLPVAGREPWPAGRAPLDLPATAVSRAYLKMQESLAAFNLPIKAGHLALEAGAAPGGACQVLLQRGLSVLAVDPAKLAPVVAQSPNLKHLRMQIGQVPAAALQGVQWYFSDMNVPAAEALAALVRIQELAQGKLRGGVITLKLPVLESPLELSVWRALLKNAGFSHARFLHLCSHRSEICVGFSKEPFTA